MTALSVAWVMYGFPGSALTPTLASLDTRGPGPITCHRECHESCHEWDHLEQNNVYCLVLWHQAWFYDGKRNFILKCQVKFVTTLPDIGTRPRLPAARGR